MNKIIRNGDHAEFEIEHANTPPEQRPDWPLPSFDAVDWAKAFVKLHGGDEDLMRGWFANALMRGYDERTLAQSSQSYADGMEDAVKKVLFHFVMVRAALKANNIWLAACEEEYAAAMRAIEQRKVGER